MQPIAALRLIFSFDWKKGKLHTALLYDDFCLLIGSSTDAFHISTLLPPSRLRLMISFGRHAPAQRSKVVLQPYPLLWPFCWPMQRFSPVFTNA